MFVNDINSAVVVEEKGRAHLLACMCVNNIN